MSFYTNVIRDHLAQLGEEADPRLVEAWMRVAHPTLDHLSAEDVAREVRVALACLSAAPIAESERLARSYGL